MYMLTGHVFFLPLGQCGCSDVALSRLITCGCQVVLALMLMLHHLIDGVCFCVLYTTGQVDCTTINRYLPGLAELHCLHCQSLVSVVGNCVLHVEQR